MNMTLTGNNILEDNDLYLLHNSEDLILSKENDFCLVILFVIFTMILYLLGFDTFM